MGATDQFGSRAMQLVVMGVGVSSIPHFPPPDVSGSEDDASAAERPSGGGAARAAGSTGAEAATGRPLWRRWPQPVMTIIGSRFAGAAQSVMWPLRREVTCRLTVVKGLRAVVSLIMPVLCPSKGGRREPGSSADVAGQTAKRPSHIRPLQCMRCHGPTTASGCGM